MKTNRLILLALGLQTALTVAAPQGAPSKAPTLRPAAIARQASLRPAAAPANIGRQTPPPSFNRTSGNLSATRAANLQQAQQATRAIRELGELRGFSRDQTPENLRIPSIPQPGKKPDLSLSGQSNGQNREVRNPLERSRNGGRTDIRNGFNRSRQGNATSGMSPTADRVFASESSQAAGRSGTCTTPEYSTDPDGSNTATTTCTSPDGTTTSVTTSEESNGSGTTTTTHTNDGHIDTITTTRRDSTGAVLWSNTDTVYPDGKQHIVIRDGSGRVTDEETRVRTRGCGGRGEDLAAGGPVNGNGPTVASSAGLVSLDLLRQFANGSAPSSGNNRMTSGTLHANQVRPTDASPQTPTGVNRVHTNPFDTLSNPGPIDGGDPARSEHQ